jgi:hypothetical protein
MQPHSLQPSPPRPQTAKTRQKTFSLHQDLAKATRDFGRDVRVESHVETVVGHDAGFMAALWPPRAQYIASFDLDELFAASARVQQDFLIAVANFSCVRFDDAEPFSLYECASDAAVRQILLRPAIHPISTDLAALCSPEVLERSVEPGAFDGNQRTYTRQALIGDTKAALDALAELVLVHPMGSGFAATLPTSWNGGASLPKGSPRSSCTTARHAKRTAQDETHKTRSLRNRPCVRTWWGTRR